ncbi:MAG TPA: hypothetical protein VF215_12145 [Thermoanaerobaculia bacterium]
MAPNPIPANVPCVLGGFVQSFAGQTAKVMNGTTVLAQISAPAVASPAVRPMLSGSGPIATFTSPANPANLTIQITNTGAQKSQVVSAYETVTWGTRVFTGQWTFAVDDSASGGDCDFNDAVITLTWTASIG